MEIQRWMVWDRVMRVTHLYTGLFLVPWMMVYAISAFCLNHYTWFDALKLTPKWATVREARYTPDATFPKAPQEQAIVLLRHLDLEGPHNIMGAPNANQLSLWRSCAAGNYRITWQRQNSRLLVEQQQPASFYSFVNNLHFIRGYPHPYLATQVWAVVVDITAISTIIWVISGIWLWARKPRERRLGGLCLASGCLLFVVLAVLLCR
jgi:hypothetical protein